MAELISCPECKKHLQVPQELLGQQVQCPECNHLFTAALPESTGFSSKPTTVPVPKETKKPQWEQEPEAEPAPPPKRKRDHYDDEDEAAEDDRPRRRSSRRDRETPHRGGMILAFGLIGLIGMWFLPVVGLVFAILAWVMGSSDLNEMHAGRMDPEGESSTNAGKIMGMIAVILHIVGVVVSIVLVLVMGFGAFAGMFGCCCLGAMAQPPGGPGGPQPRRKF